MLEYYASRDLIYSQYYSEFIFYYTEGAEPGRRVSGKDPRNFTRLGMRRRIDSTMGDRRWPRHHGIVVSSEGLSVGHVPPFPREPAAPHPDARSALQFDRTVIRRHPRRRRRRGWYRAGRHGCARRGGASPARSPARTDAGNARGRAAKPGRPRPATVIRALSTAARSRAVRAPGSYRGCRAPSA